MIETPFFNEIILYMKERETERERERERELTLSFLIGMLSAFMAFIEPGDEVLVFEPFFDQYVNFLFPVVCGRRQHSQPMY